MLFRLLGLDLDPGKGPQFGRPVRTEAAVARLAVPDMDALRYVFDAVAVIRRELDGKVPLIGFAGSPWTIACYMVEGRGSNDYRLIKSMLYARPDLLHRILRSEEHTSELQSLMRISYAVFCLKKKTIHKSTTVE